MRKCKYGVSWMSVLRLEYKIERGIHCLKNFGFFLNVDNRGHVGTFDNTGSPVLSRATEVWDVPWYRIRQSTNHNAACIKR